MVGDDQSASHGDADGAAGYRHPAQQPPTTRTSHNGARASHTVTPVG